MARRTTRRQAMTNGVGGGAMPDLHIGGRLSPLSADEATLIVDHALEILSTIGMSGLPQEATERALNHGALHRDDGRLCFPAEMIRDACNRAPKHVHLPGFNSNRDLTIGGGRVHIGTGGAAVQMLDTATGTYRDSQLHDLYELMRVLDASPHIHHGVRPVIARDLTDPFELDVNSAFACVKATSKPIGVGFCEASHGRTPCAWSLKQCAMRLASWILEESSNTCWKGLMRQRFWTG